jgi:hypothetical protein
MKRSLLLTITIISFSICFGQHRAVLPLRFKDYAWKAGWARPGDPGPVVPDIKDPGLVKVSSPGFFNKQGRYHRYDLL